MSTGGTDHDPLSPSSEKPQASLLPSQTAEATLGAGHLPQTEEGRRTTMDRAEVKATARPSQQLPQDDGKLKKKKRTVVLKPTVRGSLSPSPVGQADAPEDIEAVGTADELLGLLSGLAERQKQLETRLEGWVDKQCDGMLRQDQLLSELLSHLSAKARFQRRPVPMTPPALKLPPGEYMRGQDESSSDSDDS
ncbi:hypothetical protein AK812_SmicGene10630 [Symbiodinium microadriaticum]|uniref:Uncharacterized protein n=1 Tax=Symbiodinium microadriaticum TaxID=2951 RepID=A0A1Q9EFA4_SYMMI|nr:hypothetical protein AK812_SmicGene10630 [Symbiodinium microadriaticum]